MITGFYAGILALFYVALSYRIVQLRRINKVSLGDGGVKELQKAIAAHTNAGQYVPIAVILSFIVEYQQVPIILIHLAGLILVFCRVLHTISIVKPSFKRRTLSMALTFGVIILLALIAIIWPLVHQ